MKKIFSTTAALLTLPLLASAQVHDLWSAFDYVDNILKYLLGFMMPLATAAFFWNVIKYIKYAGEGDSKKMAEGRQAMIWTGVALFLMVGIWAVVAYVLGSIGINTGSSQLQGGPGNQNFQVGPDSVPSNVNDINNNLNGALPS